MELGAIAAINRHDNGGNWAIKVKEITGGINDVTIIDCYYACIYTCIHKLLQVLIFKHTCIYTYIHHILFNKYFVCNIYI